MEHIIVQAGGKGTRMEHLTRNKPKSLVPINNLPMLFHLFQKYPDKKYIIIGDYKYDVLERYLKAFAKVDFKMVCATGFSGTCAGINSALRYVPYGKPFMLIWSDLILPNEFVLPSEIKTDYIGISKDFRCRWKYTNGEFVEEASLNEGVAGLFIFQDKSVLTKVPDSGELVRWMCDQRLVFNELPLYKTKEYGLISEYQKLEPQKCRPFNKIIIEDDYIIKEGIDDQGWSLAKREKAWYEKVMSQNFKNIPYIYSLTPLKMERIKGKNIYEYNLGHEQKKEVLVQLIDCIKDIHKLEKCKTDPESYYEAYIGKTFDRLKKVYNLVPFAKDEYIHINGRTCKNVFFQRKEIERLIQQYMPDEFVLLHGDCTFSNMMLKEDRIPVMIDPRGYFGFTEFYGDAAYDWVKLYYSVVGNYDQFNLKRFILEIEDYSVKLEIESNHWEDMEDTFFELLKGEVTKQQIQLLHAITWLSLTTYAWEDYDSICGAFYNGVYYLNDIISLSTYLN